RPANTQGTRGRTERVGIRTREGVLVEVAAEPVVDRARTRWIAQQVGPLRAVPQRAAGLADLDGKARLQREEAAQFPAADDAIHDAVDVRAEGAAAAEGDSAHRSGKRARSNR